MSALPGKRGLRWLLLASASLSAIALFLLATATANTGLFAQGYDNAAGPQRRADRAADARRRLAAVAIAPQPEGGGLRVAPRRAARVPVRAGGRAAGRARLRGVGAVHRPQHRELVRRARGSRPRRRLEPRPQLARLSAEGDGEQGRADGGRAGRQSRQPRRRVEPRRRAGQCLRGRAVLADRQRARDRGHGRIARDTRAAAAAGVAPRAAAAAVHQDRAERRRRPAAARRGAGQHRRQPQSAEAAAGRSNRCRRRSRRTPNACRPACATIRSCRSRARR